MLPTLRSFQWAIGIILLVVPASFAQIPERFTNLKLLDAAIEKNELVETMRDWSAGLGVRCNHCHVGPDDLEGMDFASDEKATKRTARRMLELSRTLNRDLMAGLPTVVEDGRPRARVVSCYTCHRGLPKPPRQLFNELADAAQRGGAEDALLTYDSLWEEHYGSGRYDFSADTLDRLGIAYARAGELEEAKRLLEGNAERHPDAVSTQNALGVVLLHAGDRDGARGAFERALKLDPENPDAARGLASVDTADE